MIETTAEVQGFQKGEPPPKFDVMDPKGNPLIASAPVSVLRQDDSIALTWNADLTTQPAEPLASALIGMVEHARRSVARFPQNSRLRTNLALALVNAGDLDAALAQLRTALELDPNDYVAATILARVCAKVGYRTEAEAVYQELLRRNSADLTALVSLVYLALQADDVDKAESLVKRTLTANPSSAVAYFLSGFLHIRKGSTRLGIREFRTATRHDLRSAVYHHALGVAYALGQDYIRAERSFKTAFALSPGSGSILHSLCRTLVKLNKAGDAVEILQPYVETHPADRNARQLLAWAYIENVKYSRARSQLMQLLQCDSGSVSACEQSKIVSDIATTLLFEGKLMEAESGLKRAIEIDTGASPLAYENLARLYMQAGRDEEAVAILQRAAGIFTDRQMTVVLMSYAHARLDAFGTAIGLLRPLYESGSGCVEVYCLLSWAQSWIGDLDSAVLVIEAGYRRFPKHPGIINNLVYTYLRLGRVSDARKALHSLPKHFEPHAELIATKGLLRIWEGEIEEARSLYERAYARAAGDGNKELAKRVRQKMHLELARHFGRAGQIEAARTEIRRGLGIVVDTLSFRRHLEELEQELL